LNTIEGTKNSLHSNFWQATTNFNIIELIYY